VCSACFGTECPPWNRVFIQKLIVAHLFSMEPGATFPCP
jgi:hypothetical protein